MKKDRFISLRITSWGHVRATLYERRNDSWHIALKVWETDQNNKESAVIQTLQKKMKLGNYAYKCKLIPLE